jgi:hypothetical protein
MDAWLESDVARALRLLDGVANELPTAPTGPLFQFGPQVVYLYLTLGRLEQAKEAALWVPDRPVLQALRFQLTAFVTVERGSSEDVRNLLKGRPPDELRQVRRLLLEVGLIDDWRRVQAFIASEGPGPQPENDLSRLEQGQLALERTMPYVGSGTPSNDPR